MGERTAGLFVSHHTDARVKRHFDRLVEETGHLFEWHFVLGGTGGALPAADSDLPQFSRVLPERFAQMHRDGGLVPGYLDVLIVPWVLALGCDYAWVMEYDVDYAGRWADFFGQFTRSDADLLTSTLTPASSCEFWVHWSRARYPAWVEPRCLHRAFHPLVRLSRTFAAAYARMMLDPEWAGHAEFTLPTAALAAGALVEDIGGDGPLTPPDRRHANYLNTPSRPHLSPGTFVWRPVREHYFHERPDEFDLPGRLYHPVKPGMPAWEQTPQ